MSETSGQKVGRREFIGGAAAATGVMIVKPEVAFGSQANSAIQLGLVGCGGRGTGVTASFLENTSAVVTALGDVFQDRLDLSQERLDEVSAEQGKPAVESSRTFRGMDACAEVAGNDAVDAVYVATPAYFHPDHLEAVLRAGKHVYLEKPVGVDVAGCKRVMELGKQAEGKVSLAVGFQIRKASAFVALVERIHNGQIGLPITGLIHYFASALERPDTPGASPLQRRLRNWVWDKVLSGDIIVEQNVHIIDVTNWVLDAHPLKAVGSGGRAGRLDDGDCWSHFNLAFDYPGDVPAMTLKVMPLPPQPRTAIQLRCPGTPAM
jgi:predicted dehydrogenase